MLMRSNVFRFMRKNLLSPALKKGQQTQDALNGGNPRWCQIAFANGSRHSLKPADIAFMHVNHIKVRWA